MLQHSVFVSRPSVSELLGIQVFTRWTPFRSPNQQHQSTDSNSKHWWQAQISAENTQ